MNMDIKKTRLLSAVFAFALLAGCASTSTDDAGQTDSANQADSADSASQDSSAAAGSDSDAAMNLETVFYFDFDQATLNSSTRAALDAQVARLKGNTTRIRLEGHADERGTREYNMALGERRANAVANYMVINGVERYRIESVSYGEERPISSASNESAWSENRRVELK
jgi:peptidoglycan-associated lipoprotein